MPPRPLTALAAALALVAVAPPMAHAQEPPAGASPAVQRVYEDYSGDGIIDSCQHRRADLQEALDTLAEGSAEFRSALENAVQIHDDGSCGGDAAAPTITPESGRLPEHGTEDGPGAIPPESGALPPEQGGAAATPAPPAAAPTAAPPGAALAPTATPTPAVVTRSQTGDLLIPGILLAIALLGAAALAAFAIASRRSPGLHHAWREAGLRMRGTWADFSDWLRLGR